MIGGDGGGWKSRVLQRRRSQQQEREEQKTKGYTEKDANGIKYVQTQHQSAEKVKRRRNEKGREHVLEQSSAWWWEGGVQCRESRVRWEEMMERNGWGTEGDERDLARGCGLQSPSGCPAGRLSGSAPKSQDQQWRPRPTFSLRQVTAAERRDGVSPTGETAEDRA